MANKKFTGLDALGAAPAANDVLPVIDVSDTTDDAAGTGKKMTVANLLTSPALTTPDLGTPTAGVLTNATGTATALTSGITNALKSATTTVNVSSATAPSSGQTLTATGASAATWQTPASGSSITLLHQGTGTDTNVAAANLDTFAISGLTAKDSLLVYVTLSSTTAATNSPISLYNTTDSKVVASIAAGGIAAGSFSISESVVRAANTALTDVMSITMNGTRGNGNAAGVVSVTAQNWSTNWTGSWSLAIRHGGVDATGTFGYDWAVYKIAGQ